MRSLLRCLKTRCLKAGSDLTASLTTRPDPRPEALTPFQSTFFLHSSRWLLTGPAQTRRRPLAGAKKQAGEVKQLIAGGCGANILLLQSPRGNMVKLFLCLLNKETPKSLKFRHVGAEVRRDKGVCSAQAHTSCDPDRDAPRVTRARALKGAYKKNTNNRVRASAQHPITIKCFSAHKRARYLPKAVHGLQSSSRG